MKAFKMEWTFIHLPFKWNEHINTGIIIYRTLFILQITYIAIMLFHITPSRHLLYFLHIIFYIRPMKQLEIYKTIFSD